MCGFHFQITILIFDLYIWEFNSIYILKCNNTFHWWFFIINTKIWRWNIIIAKMSNIMEWWNTEWSMHSMNMMLEVINVCKKFICMHVEKLVANKSTDLSSSNPFWFFCFAFWHFPSHFDKNNKKTGKIGVLHWI